MKYRLVSVEFNSFFKTGPLAGVQCHTPLSDWVDDPAPLLAQLCVKDTTGRFGRGVMGEDGVLLPFTSTNNDVTASTTINEYQVIEDNGGGLTLFVFGDGGIDGGKVIYAHTSYERHPGQLSTDLDIIDAGRVGNIKKWDGNEDDPQALYDDLDKYETWEIVAEGFGGKRTIYPEIMGIAAQLEFGVGRDDY